MIESGLYLVATPIGNLGDITERAKDVLSSVDLILAEDTRHSGKLLNHLGIKKEMQSFNDFNKEKRTPGVLRFLKEGKSVALISDAGTPGIADPGFYLVREAHGEGIYLSVLPGACAFISALVISGMPTDHFYFGNFPPKKSAQRLRHLEQFKEAFGQDFKWAPTLGFYIGAKQVTKFIGEISQVFGSSIRVVLVRELTKIYEEVLDKSAGDYAEYYKERNPKGEFVLFFHPQNKGIKNFKSD